MLGIAPSIPSVRLSCLVRKFNLGLSVTLQEILNAEWIIIACKPMFLKEKSRKPFGLRPFKIGRGERI